MRVVGPQVGLRIFVHNPRTGGVGWVDAPAVGPEDPAKATLPLRELSGVSVALPKAVRTNSATAHIYAHEGPTAIDFGLVGPTGTTLTVIGPVLEGRVFVFNPATENYGWVNLGDLVTTDGSPVGPSTPASAPDPAVSTTASATSDVVTTRADVRLWSNATANAIDFGPAGPRGTRLVLAGPREGSRVYVFNPATQNYAWVDASDVAAASDP
jgi:hypothetical protein